MQSYGDGSVAPGLPEPRVSSQRTSFPGRGAGGARADGQAAGSVSQSLHPLSARTPLGGRVSADWTAVRQAQLQTPYSLLESAESHSAELHEDWKSLSQVTGARPVPALLGAAGLELVAGPPGWMGASCHPRSLDCGPRGAALHLQSGRRPCLTGPRSDRPREEADLQPAHGCSHLAPPVLCCASSPSPQYRCENHVVEFKDEIQSRISRNAEI